MKYLQKEPFTSGANSKNFIENYDQIDWKEEKPKKKESKKKEVEDEHVDMEIELDDDVYEFVKKEAKRNKLTINDTIVKMLEEGLKLIAEEEKKDEV